MYFYNLARRRPAYTKQAILRLVQQELGPDYDVEDKSRVVASYEAHNAAVRSGVAPERLLEFDVAQGWDFEFAAVTFRAGDFHSTEIVCSWLEAIVDELMIAEEISAVTMKAIRSAQTSSGIIFHHE